MAHGPDFTKAIQSIPGRTVPPTIKMAGIALLVIGLIATVVSFLTDPVRASGAFVTNFMYFNGLAIGGFMLVPITMVTDSRWPRRVKRFCEAFALFLPVTWVAMLLFILLGGADIAYPWTHEHMPPHKAVYLTKGFWAARVLGITLLLGTLATIMWRASLRADLALARRELGANAPTHWPWSMAANAGDPAEEAARARRTQLIVAPILCLCYAWLYSVVAVDVSMSLSPHWYANMFPAWLFMSSIWSGLVYTALFSLINRDWLGVRELLPPNIYHDLGKLTFAFCMFWGYTTFAQYLPIWYGNMTEEIGFVLLRTAVAPWDTLAKTVFILCFLAPWTILLSRGLKKIPAAYIAVACLIATGQWLERFLVNMPSVDKGDALAPGLLIGAGMACGFLGALILIVTGFLARVPAATISDANMLPDPREVHVHPRAAHAAGGHH